MTVALVILSNTSLYICHQIIHQLIKHAVIQLSLYEIHYKKKPFSWYQQQLVASMLTSKVGVVKCDLCLIRLKQIWIWAKQVQVVNRSTCLTIQIFRSGSGFNLLTCLIYLTCLLYGSSQVSLPDYIFFGFASACLKF